MGWIRASVAAMLLAVAGSGGLAGQLRPPPPPVADCWPGPWIVFFDEGSAELKPEALDILRRAVAARGACGEFGLRIEGHVDRGERHGLDRRRAIVVRDVLRRNGFRGRMKVTTHGASVPRVVVPAGMAELQNRRVEIAAIP